MDLAEDVYDDDAEELMELAEWDYAAVQKKWCDENAEQCAKQKKKGGQLILLIWLN